MKDHHKLPEITLRHTRLHGSAIKPEPHLSVGRWLMRILLADGKWPIEKQPNTEPPELYTLRSGNGITLE